MGIRMHLGDDFPGELIKLWSLVTGISPESVFECNRLITLLATLFAIKKKRVKTSTV